MSLATLPTRTECALNCFCSNLMLDILVKASQCLSSRLLLCHMFQLIFKCDSIAFALDTERYASILVLCLTIYHSSAIT